MKGKKVRLCRENSMEMYKIQHLSNFVLMYLLKS